MAEEGESKSGGAQPIVIKPMEWLLEDQRPEGYVQTTDLRLRAEALGIKYAEVVDPRVRRPWRALLKKAKLKGLTESECHKVAELSIIIAHKLRQAIKERQMGGPAKRGGEG